jgi:hypothetical protein
LVAGCCLPWRSRVGLSLVSDARLNVPSARSDRILRRREAPLFVVVVIVLSEPCRRVALRRQSQIGARFGDVLDPRADDIDGERDLLDRPHAEEPMGANIARQTEQFVGGKVAAGTPCRIC